MGAGASTQTTAIATATAEANHPFQLLTPELLASLAKAAAADPAGFEKAVGLIRQEAAATTTPPLAIPTTTTTTTTTTTPTTPTTPTTTTPNDTAPLSLEEQVVDEINRCRTNPPQYATKLQEQLQYYKGNQVVRPNETILLTKEGSAAVQECIECLLKTTPLQPLNTLSCTGLRRACQDHNADTGPKGMTGHDGSDGSKPADRMNRYGMWKGGCAENISYGHSDPFRIVSQLLVDDGVPSRGHRTNLLTASFQKVGVALGTHKTYAHMCTQNFANAYQDGAPQFDRTSDFNIKDATDMTPEILSFLTIVPFDDMVETVKSSLGANQPNVSVSIDYTAPGTLKISITSKNADGGSSTSNMSCSFG